MSIHAGRVAHRSYACHNRGISDIREKGLPVAGDDAEWISVGEAAAMLGAHPETVRRYGTSGKLFVTRRGGGWRRVSAESVRELQRVEGMRDSPERDAELAALIRRNRGEPDPD